MSMLHAAVAKKRGKLNPNNRAEVESRPGKRRQSTRQVTVAKKMAKLNANNRAEVESRPGKRRRSTRQATRGVASDAHVLKATVAAKVLLYTIVLRFVYPMFRCAYFSVGDAIAENIPAHTDNRADRRLMCSLIRMPTLTEMWIECINQSGNSDLNSLAQVQKMLLRSDGKHKTEGVLYQKTVIGQRHVFNGQLTINGSVGGALNTKGNEPKNPPLAKAMVKAMRMELIRPTSVFSWVSG